MENNNKLAVIAGTITDTDMGAELIKENAPKYEVYKYPVSENPQQQTAFQLSTQDEKEKQIGKIIEDAKSKGINLFFIYCNSLSGAVDFDKMAEKYEVRIITPLKAYEEISKGCKRIGVIAANNQSLAGIERAAFLGNPNVEVIGTSLLPIVKLVEEKKEPQKIVEEWKLPELIDFFENAGAEAIVLGCTHFPWFKAEFSAYAKVPVVDPGVKMLQVLGAG